MGLAAKVLQNLMVNHHFPPTNIWYIIYDTPFSSTPNQPANELCSNWLVSFILFGFAQGAWESPIYWIVKPHRNMNQPRSIDYIIILYDMSICLTIVNPKLNPYKQWLNLHPHPTTNINQSSINKGGSQPLLKSHPALDCTDLRLQPVAQTSLQPRLAESTKALEGHVLSGALWAVWISTQKRD